MKPLSTYLQKSVDEGVLSEEVAQIINRLPDWKQQREAVEEWKERLTDPAKEVVAEFESRNKGTVSSSFTVDDSAILVNRPFFYLCDDVATYLGRFESALQNFLERTSCLVCGNPLGNGQPDHPNCRFRPDGTPWDRSKTKPEPSQTATIAPAADTPMVQGSYNPDPNGQN